MEYGFDPLAKRYTESIKKLPKEYIDLIVGTFNIDELSNIIDLGCGSGILTIPLSKHSNYVSGVDISHNMIEIAKNQGKGHKVKWIENNVDNFNFNNEYYDLIITYESIHLFPNTIKLLKKCSDGLKKYGHVCMGWCFYNWEILLEDAIVTTFRKYGIEWGEWSYQKFYKFQELINDSMIDNLSPTVNKHVDVYQEWTVSEIVDYITSISKSIELSEKDKLLIKNDLKNIIIQNFDYTIKGNTQYWIRYSQKR